MKRTKSTLMDMRNGDTIRSAWRRHHTFISYTLLAPVRHCTGNDDVTPLTITYERNFRRRHRSSRSADHRKRAAICRTPSSANGEKRESQRIAWT